MPADTHWRERAEHLADALARARTATDPTWLAAVREIPRHELVPWYLKQTTPCRWTSTNSADPAEQEAWIDAVYADTELVTLLDHGVQPPRVLSTAISPSLAVRTLDALDVHAGQFVMHIGTGSGYLTALLCHRLGDNRVSSIDIEYELITLATARLKSIGYTPTLLCEDGWHTLPEHGHYDRIVATCAVPSIPSLWLQRLTLDGVLVADLKIGPEAGNLVRLTRVDADKLEGRFLPDYTAFAPHHRVPGQCDEPRRWAKPSDSNIHIRSTTLAPDTPSKPELRLAWFLACLDLGQYAPYVHRGLDGMGNCGPPTSRVLALPEGSWAEVSLAAYYGEHRVTEGGQQSLWAVVEGAHQRWQDLGRPGWDRFGLTVTPGTHTIWLDRPDGEHRWTRPTPPELSAWTKTSHSTD